MSISTELAELRTRLASVNERIEAAESGASYSTGELSFERADLQTLYRERERIQRKINERLSIQASGGRSILGARGARFQ